MHAKRKICFTVVLQLVLITLSWSVGCGSEEVASDSSNVESSETSSTAITDEADETHLYLGALQYGINWRMALDSGRIADSQVQGVEMVYSKPGEDGAVDIRAYVKVCSPHLLRNRSCAHAGRYG
jgi:hypothetical protein